MKYGKGWRPDKPNRFDHVYSGDPGQDVPGAVSLRTSPFNFPAFDQGPWGSCVGQGVARICRFALRKAGKPDIMPSRMAIYGLGRRLEGTLDSDAGMEIRDGLLVVAADGIVPEDQWDYSESHLTEIPPNSLLHDAKQHKAIEYLRLKRDDDLYHIRHCIAQGWPVTFGFTCYERLDADSTARTGIIPLPRRGEQVIGGHCMVVDEFNHAKRKVSGYNSWGTAFGDQGRFIMDYEWLLDEGLSDDFWTVRTMA